MTVIYFVLPVLHGVTTNDLYTGNEPLFKKFSDQYLCIVFAVYGCYYLNIRMHFSPLVQTKTPCNLRNKATPW